MPLLSNVISKHYAPRGLFGLPLSRDRPSLQQEEMQRAERDAGVAINLTIPGKGSILQNFLYV